MSDYKEYMREHPGHYKMVRDGSPMFHDGGLVEECLHTVREVVGSIPGRVIPKDCKNR